MRISGRNVIFVGLACLLFCQYAHAAITGMTRVASGLSSPMFVTHAPGDTSRLFIAERGSGTSTNATATIKILNLNTGTVNSTPFLSIPGININGEGGFLGMAFSPNYATDNSFYVYVTAGPSTTTFTSYIRKYTVSANADVANAGFSDVLNVAQPAGQTNHKGGWIGFSPNNANNLYVMLGDGGGAGDDDAGHTPTTGNGQDITTNLGKVLRVNVNGDDFGADATKNYAIPAGNPFAGVTTGNDEIYAYGVRNPFRASFDRLTGDLWIGDVGQGAEEEIDLLPASRTEVANFGWRLWEGDDPYGAPGPSEPKPPHYVGPQYDYGRPNSDPSGDPSNLYKGSVVTGGYVYRGPDPSLQGKYFFLDSGNSSGTTDDNYWMGTPGATSLTGVTNINSALPFNTGTHQFPSSFGEDANGNLYVAYLSSGEVYRLSTNQLLTGDFNADGTVNAADYVLWRNGGTMLNTAADSNGNGIFDSSDYTAWRSNFGASVHPGLGGGGDAAIPEPGSALLIGQLIVLSLLLKTARPRRGG